MNYPIQLAGFEGQTIELASPGLLSGARLLVNGAPAPKGPKRGTMLLTRNDGSQAVARFRPHLRGGGVPQLEVDGEKYPIVEPLSWGVIAWSALPLIGLGGGLIGVIIGVLAMQYNFSIFRSERSIGQKYLLTGVVSAVSIALGLAIGLLVLSAL